MIGTGRVILWGRRRDGRIRPVVIGGGDLAVLFCVPTLHIFRRIRRDWQRWCRKWAENSVHSPSPLESCILYHVEHTHGFRCRCRCCVGSWPRTFFLFVGKWGADIMCGIHQLHDILPLRLQMVCGLFYILRGLVMVNGRCKVCEWFLLILIIVQPLSCL